MPWPYSQPYDDGWGIDPNCDDGVPFEDPCAGCDPDAPYDDRQRDVLLQALFRANSSLVIIPFQDLFGWRDRVNLPGVVNDENWTWRLPWPIEELSARPEALERAAFLCSLSRDSRRCHD